MRTCLALLLACALGGCQAADPPAAVRKPAAGEVTLYKYAGSRQCSGGGITHEDARRALAAAGVEVMEAACGADGRMYTSSCGSADGRIVIVKVAARDAAAARGQGFAPLSELPEAARSRCP
jgi:hypothetical protein